MRIYDIEKTIKKAGSDKRTLEMVYARSTKPGPREVEPYEIRGGDFFGFDVEKKSIRRFKINQIESIDETDNKFNPKWDIKVE